jgi:hypothetical protein
MKQCPGCSETKPLDAFPPNRAQRDGRQSRCYPCHREYMALYRARHRASLVAYARSYYRAHPDRWHYDPSRINDEQKRRYTSAWRADHPEWVRLLNRANNTVRRALKDGRLVKERACEACGATNRKIAGAHHDYTRPLDVVWLCYPCHSRWDAADPKLPREAAS